jgi:hypothetical protein
LGDNKHTRGAFPVCAFPALVLLEVPNKARIFAVAGKELMRSSCHKNAGNDGIVTTLHDTGRQMGEMVSEEIAVNEPGTR